MTLDDALRVARSIQRDLEAGRLTTPYPEPVRRSLRVAISVFMRESSTKDKAEVIVARLQATDDPADVVVPGW